MSAKHWKKRLTSVDPLDFSPGLLRIQAQPPSLAPGMQVTAEIHIGTRTILEYLLSPVLGAFQEAGRER